ncbi:unnamed protein product [Adineta steineri]|uniref:DYW domain-containing protein n=1 Tax=Adineta steineri TaxID=433720 RepID=A0A815UHJ7_9BILA|nr:unnamed protein product [Adineta steineri]CAF1514039.1 unnamed protein product [Adineta steineri]
MLTKILKYYSSSLVVSVKRSVTIQSNSHLSTQMKLLNDNKQFKKALVLFDKHTKNNADIFSSSIITQALKACTHLRDLERGKTIHGHLISTRTKNDLYTTTSLIHLYMQCNDIQSAQLLFDTTTTKNVTIYGAMMKGYIKNNQAKKAVDLFNQIETPNEIIINLLFNACAQLGTFEALNLVIKISNAIPKSFHSNSILMASLLDALMKCDDIEHAESLFDKRKNKTIQMYGAMMKGYVQNNQAKKAIDLFNQIVKPDEIIMNLFFNACAQLGTLEALNLVNKVSNEIPNSFRSNHLLIASLLDALMKCGDIKQAESLFDKTTNKTIEMYGAMMNGFNLGNNPFKTLNLFNKMKVDNIKGNIIIFHCVIRALSQIADYKLSQSIIKQIPNYFFVNNHIQYALIDMWGKSGHMNLAKEVFEKLPQPNQSEYTTIIHCYGLNGMGTQAIELYYKMPKEFRDEGIYISVLNACSHSGLVQEARSIFQSIQKKTEKIYSTMIDCLSRASLFEEAQKLIDEYDHDHSPSIVMYTALLSGARNFKNTDLSQNLYDRMENFFPQMTSSLTSAAVLLANTYASSGDIDKASNIRNKLHKSGQKKQMGITSTVVNRISYEFRAYDRTHPRSKEIYAECQKLSAELLQHGHKYDSSWITRPLNEGETIESVLSTHSEKLAIAWNFVANPGASRIQLTKNLRICEDCHRATKLIAAIRKCEIIARDANRIHHFTTDGKCSCNDYF